MSTPFDEESVDFLVGLGVPAFKLPSGEVTNLSFLSYVARKGKPMILSTGMSSLDEVQTQLEGCEFAILAASKVSIPLQGISSSQSTHWRSPS